MLTLNNYVNLKFKNNYCNNARIFFRSLNFIDMDKISFLSKGSI